MKKLMMLLAVAGLMVAGCAKDQATGGTSDQNQMNNGASSSVPATPDTNGVNNTQQK